MNRLSQALNCPVSSITGAPGELDPIYCPIVYCPSTENGRDSYTASVCVKYTASPGSKYFYEKLCFNEVCDYSCNALKSKDIAQTIAEKKDTPNFVDNYHMTISVGCRNGDFRGVDNQTVVFPNSTIETFTSDVEVGSALSSSSNRLQITLLLPLFMVLVLLLTNKFTRRTLQ
ncbi:unnamed protein product [Mucor hiemalis]